MNDDVVRNLKEPSHWLRVFFMLGFAIVLYVVGIVVLVITLAQLLFSLITGSDNPNLRSLGASLSRYVFEILQYLTYNTELKPFPFAPFPFVEADSAINETPAGAAYGAAAPAAAPVEPVVTSAAPAAATATTASSIATPEATDTVSPTVSPASAESDPGTTEPPAFTSLADNEEGTPR